MEPYILWCVGDPQAKETPVARRGVPDPGMYMGVMQLLS